jgi:phage-related baseplate assembly protein
MSDDLNLNLLNLSVEEMLDAFKTAYYDKFGSTMKIGSDEFAVSSIMSYCLAVFFAKANDSFKQRFIDTATGQFLDAIALTYGITERPGGAKATTRMQMTIAQRATVYDAGTVKVKDEAGHIFENAVPFSWDSYHISYGVTFRAVETGTEYNGIPVGKLNTFVVPVDTLSDPHNVSITSGGLDDDFYADDDTFRVWLKNEIASFAGCGTANAYRGKAMNVDHRILDAFVYEQGQDGYERGKVRVRVLTDESVDDEVLQLVNAALQDPAFRPVGDMVVVERAIPDGQYIDGTCHITFPARFRLQAENHVTQVFEEYKAYLKQKIGRPFVYADFVNRLLEKDADGVYATEAVFSSFIREDDQGKCFAPVYPYIGCYLSISPITYVIHYDESDA